MGYKQGLDRDQSMLLPPSVEEYVDQDNPVRVIDAFVDTLDLEEAEFTKSIPADTGCPGYSPCLLLKLYIYGYLNGIRSSRKLENECKRNLEVIWLLNGLKPRYRSIAYFRADNKKAIKNIFRQFVVMMKSWDLIGGDTLGVDGTKFRAVNSKKNNYNQKKIDRHLKYIDDKIEQYLKELEEQDDKEKSDKKVNVEQCLEELEKRKQKYQELEKQLKETGEGQVSTTDEDARALIIRGQIVEVAYNAQAVVDDKHKLIVNYKNINTNDRKILSTMATETKEIIEEESFDLLADKGYHNSEELQNCKDEKIKTYVAPSERKHNKPIPIPEYTYNPKEDCYICPQGQTLTTNGSWYKKVYHNNKILIKQYKTKACRECPERYLCTTSPIERGRVIERSQYQQAVEENNLRVNTEKEKYRKRQAIVEHPFGTIKRQWGYTYTLLKGIEKVEAEIGLMFTAYNLRRLISIFGVKELIDRLLLFFINIVKIWLIIKRYKQLKIPLQLYQTPKFEFVRSTYFS
jgi:transposase